LQVLHETGAPLPAPFCNQVKNILKQVWKSKEMIPRVKTFIWRILRRVLPTGDRASRYSKHIEKTCCRFGLPKTDFHLFFLCPFAKAAWFLNPWFLRSKILTQNVNSFATVLHSLNHPEENMNFIATFLWCLWKTRNNDLFGRKKTKPHQVAMHAKALLQDLEVTPLLPNTVNAPTGHQHRQVGAEKSGETISADFNFVGPKLYVDAAWKPRPKQTTMTAGLGIYNALTDQDPRTDIFSAASSPAISLSLQAVAQALRILAANFASSLNMANPGFFTDCSNLEKAAAAPGATDQAMLWEIRRQAIEFQNVTLSLQLRIFHISREINGVAHQCARQAKQSTCSRPTRSCRNLAHRNMTCLVLVAIDHLRLLDFVIIDIQCL
jgi:hypothetical protein